MPSCECKDQNVIGVEAFKNHIGIWFHQGVLLSDPFNIMINAQEGKMKAMRSIQITKDKPLDEKILRINITEAIENALKGKQIATSKARKVDPNKIDFPIELRLALDEDVDLRKKFDRLTNIQQYDYADYISSAKGVSTKISRLERIIPLILDSKPLSASWRMK